MFKASLPILLLLCTSPVVQSCLQCDRVVVYLHEDFIVSQDSLTVQEQKDLQNIIDHGYVIFQQLSGQYHGVIGVYVAMLLFGLPDRLIWQKFPKRFYFLSDKEKSFLLVVGVTRKLFFRPHYPVPCPHRVPQ